MKWVKNDGGRAGAGYVGIAGDCVCRSVAIATGLPYSEVYDKIKCISRAEHITRQKRNRSSPRNGVFKYSIHRLMKELGWTWVPTMFIGQGCKVHLKESELPRGNLVVSLSRHCTAVIDGVIHDMEDPSREGTRCVYGYWQKICP